MYYQVTSVEIIELNISPGSVFRVKPVINTRTSRDVLSLPYTKNVAK